MTKGEKEVSCPGGCERTFWWPDDYYDLTMHLARDHEWGSSAIDRFIKGLERRYTRKRKGF